MIYQNYHCHKDYTNPRISDSAARIRDYAERAAALGHGILSSVEHGWQGNYYECWKTAKKYDLKLLIGAEAYWVKDRTEKDSTNAHICLQRIIERLIKQPPHCSALVPGPQWGKPIAFLQIRIFHPWGGKLEIRVPKYRPVAVYHCFDLQAFLVQQHISRP